MGKPREISRFATLALIACLINLVSTLTVLDFARQAWLASGLGAAIAIGFILWVALGRSLIGRLIVTIWLAFGIGAGLAGYAMMLAAHRPTAMGPLLHVLSVVTILLNCVALFFLWSRPSTAWLRRAAPDAA